MVGKVSNTMEIDFGRDTGYGFNITDESGRPLASFVYKMQQEAIAAAIQARLLIENAVSVIGAPPDIISTVPQHAARLQLLRSRSGSSCDPQYRQDARHRNSGGPGAVATLPAR